jgi:hypothetical protein
MYSIIDGICWFNIAIFYLVWLLGVLCRRLLLCRAGLHDQEVRGGLRLHIHRPRPLSSLHQAGDSPACQFSRMGFSVYEQEKQEIRSILKFSRLEAENPFQITMKLRCSLFYHDLHLYVQCTHTGNLFGRSTVA